MTFLVFFLDDLFALLAETGIMTHYLPMRVMGSPGLRRSSCQQRSQPTVPA